MTAAARTRSRKTRRSPTWTVGGPRLRLRRAQEAASRVSLFPTADESGSDEDFMVEDDDDSDYGQSKKRGKKVIRRGRPDKKERKSPKPRLKATGERPRPPFQLLPV